MRSRVSNKKTKEKGKVGKGDPPCPCGDELND